MGIRLIYGLKTTDASYLDSFYPTRRLSEAARSIGIDYAAAIFDPDAPIDTTVEFCRGHRALLRGELPMSLYETLELRGVSVANGAAATSLARDKLESARFFSSISAAHPKTLGIDPSSQEPPLPFPFVRKPRYGKMGRGVALVENAPDWSAFRASEECKATEFIAQVYIASSRGIDVRFFFADFPRGGADAPWAPRVYGEATSQPSIAALRKGPGLASNAHAGGSMEAFPAPVEMGMEASRIFAHSGLTYGTVDFFLADDDRPPFIVCEINSCPGFQELERASGADVAVAILRAAGLRG